MVGKLFLLLSWLSTRHLPQSLLMSTQKISPDRLHLTLWKWLELLTTEIQDVYHFRHGIRRLPFRKEEEPAMAVADEWSLISLVPVHQHLLILMYNLLSNLGGNLFPDLDLLSVFILLRGLNPYL